MGIFDFLKKKHKTANPPPASTDKSPDSPKVYNRRVKVAGVTFNNEDGTSRQKILESIYKKKKPFDKQLNISIEETEYEGNPAYRILVNGQCVGMVESDMAAFISANKSRILGISDFKVNYVDENDSGDEYHENHKEKPVYYARAKIVVKSKQ